MFYIHTLSDVLFNHWQTETPVILTRHPLHPDDVILVFGRREFLQVVAVVGLDAVRVVAQVFLVCVEQEVLHHVCHLHFLKHGQEDAFAHTADPTATVQSAMRASLTGTLRRKQVSGECNHVNNK